jgi:hypothetical protein
MSRRWLAVLALIAALSLVAPAAMADQGKGKGKGHLLSHRKATLEPLGLGRPPRAIE